MGLMPAGVSPSRADGFNGARDASLFDRARVEIHHGEPVCWIQRVKGTEDLLRRAGMLRGTRTHEFAPVRVRRDEYLARWEMAPTEEECRVISDQCEAGAEAPVGEVTRRMAKELTQKMAGAAAVLAGYAVKAEGKQDPTDGTDLADLSDGSDEEFSDPVSAGEGSAAGASGHADPADPMGLAAGDAPAADVLPVERRWGWRAVLARRMRGSVARMMEVWAERKERGQCEEWLREYRGTLRVCLEREEKVKRVMGEEEPRMNTDGHGWMTGEGKVVEL
jgi:hypothetical protein